MPHVDNATRDGADSSRAGTWLHSARGRAAVVTVIVGVVFYLSTYIETVPDWLLEGIQPSGYPRGVLVAILIFTGIMLLEEKERAGEEQETAPWLVYKTIALMAGTLAISTYIDFFLGMIVFIAVAIPMWGLRRYGFAIAYALLTAATIYVVFATALGVRFPHGPLTSLLP